MKKFNTTAVCIPSKHYMVDLSKRVEEIKKLVDAGKYFTINRARQYGKTRDQTRTDVIVDYLGQRYIIELKIWRGPRYNEEGEKQISEYLDYFVLTTGYMLSFNFNKNKETGLKRVEVGDKVLFECTV